MELKLMKERENEITKSDGFTEMKEVHHNTSSN